MMAVADWKDEIRPTAVEVAEARARSPGEGMAAALVRTAMAAVHTLREHHVGLIPQGDMTDGEYMNALWPFAIAATDRTAPGSPVNMAAELLGLICTLFEHWGERADGKGQGEADIKSMTLCLAIGHRAGVLMLDEAGLFDVAGKAIEAKEGRAAAIRERNAAKTAWHPAAIEKATRHRETFPRRAATQIADLIHTDPTIPTPSYEQVLETLRRWEKDGTIPPRQKARQN